MGAGTAFSASDDDGSAATVSGGLVIHRPATAAGVDPVRLARRIGTSRGAGASQGADSPASTWSTRAFGGSTAAARRRRRGRSRTRSGADEAPGVVGAVEDAAGRVVVGRAVGASRTGSCSGRRMSRTTTAHSHSVATTCASTVRPYPSSPAPAPAGPAGSPRAASRCRRSARPRRLPDQEVPPARPGEHGQRDAATARTAASRPCSVSRNAATTRNTSCGSRGRRRRDKREHRDRRRRPPRTAPPASTLSAVRPARAWPCCAEHEPDRAEARRRAPATAGRTSTSRRSPPASPAR